MIGTVSSAARSWVGPVSKLASAASASMTSMTVSAVARPCRLYVRAGAIMPRHHPDPAHVVRGEHGT